MKYLLDTNICIYIIKKHPPSIVSKFNLHAEGDIGISTITLSELNYGVEKSQHKQKNKAALAQFILPLDIAFFDEDAAESYGKIRAHLEIRGALIGPLDMMIAAHALSLDSILITNNVKEFARVPHLKIENWAAD